MKCIQSYIQYAMRKVDNEFMIQIDTGIGE